MQTETQKRYLRPREVAEENGISLSEVYRALASAELFAIRFKRNIWLIEPKDVEHWIEKNSEHNFWLPDDK